MTFGYALNFNFKARFRRVAVEIDLIFFDDADVVGAAGMSALKARRHHVGAAFFDEPALQSLVYDTYEQRVDARFFLNHRWIYAPHET